MLRPWLPLPPGKRLREAARQASRAINSMLSNGYRHTVFVRDSSNHNSIRTIVTTSTNHSYSCAQADYTQSDRSQEYWKNIRDTARAVRPKSRLQENIQLFMCSLQLAQSDASQEYRRKRHERRTSPSPTEFKTTGKT